MGAVFRTKDFGSRDNRKVTENAVKDFSPDTKDNVIKLLNSWEGKKSASKLRDIFICCCIRKTGKFLSTQFSNT
jgi:hypothetical protein